MNLTEAQQLCRLVSCFCPSQKFDRHSPGAWLLLLSNVDADDAQEAVLQLAGLELEPGKARYIEPGHIVGAVRKIRAARRVDAGQPEPPPEVADDPAAYLAWLRATNKDAAKHHRQLGGAA